MKKHVSLLSIVLTTLLPILAYALDCRDLYSSKPRFIVPVLGEPKVLSDSNTFRPKAEYIASTAGFVGSEKMFTQVEKLAFFNSGKISRLDIIVIQESADANKNNGWPYANNVLTIISDINVNNDRKFVSFEAYDYTSNRVKAVKIDLETGKMLQISFKKVALEQKTDKTVRENNSSFLRSFELRGFRWLGNNPNLPEIYNQLRPGDELVFEDDHGQRRHWLIEKDKWGRKRFLDVDNFDASYHYSSLNFLGPIHELSNKNFEKLETAQNILLRKNANPPKPLIVDKGWESEANRINKWLRDATTTWLSTNLTKRAETSPQLVVDEMVAAQAAQAIAKWQDVMGDLNNIMALRQMNNTSKYSQQQIGIRSIYRASESGSMPRQVLDLSSIKNVQLNFDSYANGKSMPEILRAKILVIDPTTNQVQLQVNTRSREEAITLYAHLLESAYGENIDSALHINNLTDFRIDLDLLRTQSLLGSKVKIGVEPNHEPKQPGFLASTQPQSDGSYTLNINFFDGVWSGSDNSALINGLIWGHNLRRE
ncbi:MAG: hypothetical protein J0M15_09230 [Deltaproteobacteria bacterium]|nr:hypothetical protein [Deltaproteobacteria bacterium]